MLFENSRIVLCSVTNHLDLIHDIKIVTYYYANSVNNFGRKPLEKIVQNLERKVWGDVFLSKEGKPLNFARYFELCKI